MRIDPTAQAQRLLLQVDPSDLAELANDPATAVEVLFDVAVTLRPSQTRGQGCAVDGTYDPGPPQRIRVADDIGEARRRFTILHELGHHMIEHDSHLNDLPINDADRRDEAICNEVAASVLIPAEVVEQTLPSGVLTAKHVAALYGATSASREACCVAAVRRLRRPGCVILGTPDGTAVFTAHNWATPWSIARGTPQGPDSLLAKAARRQTGRERSVTRVRFASGNTSGNVHGDAFAEGDGWVYQVVVADTHSPWERGLNVGLVDTWPDAEEIECGICGEASLVWNAPCRTCGDRLCPKCRRCSCPVGPASRTCHNCWLQKSPVEFSGAADICIDCIRESQHADG